MEEKADIGLIGLEVMGRNLALNVERHGYTVAVYDRAWEKTGQFMLGPGKGLNFFAAKTLAEFADGLKTPRRVMLTVDAGAAVDATIDALVPLLEAGDILIDGGDSFFEDTVRREKALAAKGFRFLGMGVSGSGEDALYGPSIMPGGSREAWLAVGKVFSDISARVEGSPCCAWIGPDGASHFVKTMHNGIENACMQLIAESYRLMKDLLGMSAQDMQAVFRLWNTGALESYLIGITRDILGNIDKNTGKPLIDTILDESAQNDVVRWTGRQALDTYTPAPTIAEAVFARCISALKNERMAASRQIALVAEKPALDKYAFIDDIGKALYAAMICSYAQGFALMRAVSAERNWGLKPGEIAMLWRGGSIIRANLLNLIKAAFDDNPLLPNLMLAPVFREALEEAQPSWRRVVSAAALSGVPTPCFSSSLSYFDSYRSAELPTNLIQAQRDYFGAHTYKRVDMAGDFHTEWEKDE